jgi:hypothetical protein
MFRRRHNSAWREIFFLGILWLCLALPCLPQSPPNVPASDNSLKSKAPAAMPGNEACAKCHSAIYATYITKPMARGSGPATQDFLPGEFRDPGSGVFYRVHLEKGDAWLSFNRDGEAPLHGKRKLEYFIGSGHRGKTFVFSHDGFSFESPINFYSRPGGAPGGVWDMAPKHQGATEMPLNSPAFSSCLSCHTSDAQALKPAPKTNMPRPCLRTAVLLASAAMAATCRTAWAPRNRSKVAKMFRQQQRWTTRKSLIRRN